MRLSLVSWYTKSPLRTAKESPAYRSFSTTAIITPVDQQTTDDRGYAWFENLRAEIVTT